MFKRTRDFINRIATDLEETLKSTGGSVGSEIGSSIVTATEKTYRGQSEIARSNEKIAIALEEVSNNLGRRKLAFPCTGPKPDSEPLSPVSVYKNANYWQRINCPRIIDGHCYKDGQNKNPDGTGIPSMGDCPYKM
jgi:hypothetical protein